VNGGAGQGIRVRDVLSELFVVFGRTDEPAFSGVTRGGDPAAYAADIERARNWGWQPKIQWREGVREYAAWFGNSQP
jgi:nucleoside-diphosphate-sugar epimerase